MTQQAYSTDDRRLRGPVRDAVLAPVVSLFGAPEALEAMAQDCRATGLEVRGARPLSALLDGSGGMLGDIVLVDCPSATGAEVLALLRLDERAARSGAELVVSTSAGALDTVFGCLETARAQFLLDPGAAERVVAVGHALARLPGHRLREMDEGERVALLRLTEEVGKLAAKLDRIALPLGPEQGHGMSDRLASPGSTYQGEPDRDMRRQPRPPLPDPRLIHRIIHQRRLRSRYFEGELFADPAWDILLDLTAARAEHRRVSVTSLCIAAAVPPTTALRWIQQMTDMRVLLREADPDDRRRAFIALSDSAADAMARYFAELGKDAAATI